MHRLVQPRGYIEIGVQQGGSLQFAKCAAVGIDPAPMVVAALHPGVTVHVATSDVYFSNTQWDLPTRVDLAFIDGMHLAEYALRDFINVERVGHSQTIVVFDDVLPYNADIATRVQPPGDWTGDVWKVSEVLKRWRPDLRQVLVDTKPTGSLIVFNLNPADDILRRQYNYLEATLTQDEIPPASVINRADAISIDAALKIVEEYIG
jgi:hypothetical protein